MNKRSLESTNLLAGPLVAIVESNFSFWILQTPQVHLMTTYTDS